MSPQGGYGDKGDSNVGRQGEGEYLKKPGKYGHILWMVPNVYSELAGN